MSINEKIRDLVRSWLLIEAYNKQTNIIIKEYNSYKTNAQRNAIWYRGDPSELHQFYNKVDDGMGNTSFWRATSSTGIDFRKIHTGLPALIVDKLVDIVIDDMNDIKFLTNQKDPKTGKSIEDIAAKERWEIIEKEHEFKKKVLKKAVRYMLIYGDCSIKGSFDPNVSDFPLIEVIPGTEVDYEYKRSRLVTIDFYFKKILENKEYILEEKYEQGGVRYALYDKDGHETTVGMIEELQDLIPIEYGGRFILAVQMMLDESEQFPGRGKSIFDGGKTGAFDSFDETWSQWIDALRDGKTRTYIPEDLIPKDPKNGSPMKPSTFDARFIASGTDKAENGQNKIQVESPDIRPDKYLTAYVTALDLALQGLISPSTLGIDVKKLDNAEAQREKEKTTMYTRSKIINVLSESIPAIVEMILKMDDLLKNKELGKYNVSVDFGEYANPSFEAQIETIGKAKSSGIMSVETIVDQLYGDSWTEEERKGEVDRLKKEQGIDIDQPTINEFDQRDSLDGSQ